MNRDGSVHPPPDRRLDEPAEADPPPVRVAAAADEDAASSVERPLPLHRRKDDGAEVVAFPRPVSVKRRRAEPPVAEDGEEDEPFERPAYLASELLRQDWFPAAPLARTLRWCALAFGAVGAAGSIAVGEMTSGLMLLTTILVGCALAGAIPMSPPRRGGLLVLLGLTGCGLAGWLRMTHDPAAPLLAFGVAVTAGAFFFRAAHRRSRSARIVLAVGLLALASWLVLDGGLDALMVESFAWQDWLDPLMRVALGLILIAGTLTFLDPSGHGGAWAMGGALLGWFGASAAATMATLARPAHGTASIDTEAWAAAFAHPFLAALAAGGLCQLWARLANGARAELEAVS